MSMRAHTYHMYHMRATCQSMSESQAKCQCGLRKIFQQRY